MQVMGRCPGCGRVFVAVPHAVPEPVQTRFYSGQTIQERLSDLPTEVGDMVEGVLIGLGWSNSGVADGVVDCGG